MSNRLKITLILLAAAQLAACRHLYAGGDAGALRVADHPAPVSRN
jgi:hypothetical protein